MDEIFFPAFLNKADSPAEDIVGRFRNDGFIVFEEVFTPTFIALQNEALDHIFHGRFDTGTYPDSWLWQHGTSFENLPRQAVNAWKSDRRVAALVTALPVAAMATRLMGWSGARLAADSIWMKPPHWRYGGYHQDTMEVFGPTDMITCWVPLTPVSERNGSLVYARGSHRWADRSCTSDTSNPGDQPRDYVLALGAAQGEAVDFCAVEAPAGSIAFHHGLTWHGSQANETDDWRNAIAIHLIRPEAQFAQDSGGHVLGRYKKSGSHELDENFFPLLAGRRSPFIDRYCDTGTRG